MLFHSVLTLALAAVASAQSAPVAGQQNRFRGAQGNSLLSVAPVDGAEFIPDQYFDVSIELHNDNSTAIPDISAISATINGAPIDKFFGKGFNPVDTWTFNYFVDSAARDAKKPTPVGVSRLSLRSIKIAKPGVYKVELKVGSQTATANWVVRSTGQRKVKNMVLFIGDGMATSMISAARYVSKKSTFGKFGDNLLEIEKLGTIGKVMTNGIDAMITDSANSAAAYNSGHKGWVNALNVYVDTSDDGLDDPKVETIGEYIRRTRPGMCIGVVTTTDIQDATPAAVYAHTRKRGQFDVITDQLINPFKPTSGNMTWDPKPARPDVILGGGGSSFCIKSDSKPSCQGTTTNYYDLFAKAGYQVVNNKDQLAAVKDDAPVLGIFNSNNMNYWLDRHVFTDNVKSSGNPDGSGTGATNQPDLEQMAMTAVKVMSKKCNDGFFLMVEGGLIDVGMHNMDYDRGLSELLELDRTVAAVNKWAKENGDNTGMMVTADHAHAYDVYASIDTQYFNSLPNDDKNILGDADRGLQIQKHLAIGEYAEAGWVDSVMDENGLPTKWNGRYRLASGKVDGPQLRENWQVRTSPRSAATQDRSLANKIPGAPTVMVANPAEPAGINRGSMVTPGNYRSVHSLQGVDLYCGGPWYFRRNCARVIDNTEVFFIMADALGLGYSPSNPKTRDC